MKVGSAMKRHYLYPGQLAAFREETLISTLLGSCVAVALFDSQNRVGGLNHFLLPECSPNEVPTPRYGSFAIPQLVEEVLQLGARRENLKAKIYGGGNVIDAGQLGLSVGTRNIQFAEKTLKDLRIPIVDQDTGGESARTIRFNTSTSEVLHILNRQKDDKEPVSISGFQTITPQKKVRVLIVDDSATVRTLFSQIFTKAGFEVVGTAADPYQAREMVVQTKPDVLTLDIEMPKMSGVDFLEKLMKHAPIPVVMVSSLASQGEAAMRSLSLGAVEFVHKPSQFDPSVLKELALQLVEKVRAAATVNVLKLRKKAEDHQQTLVEPSAAGLKKRADLRVVLLGGNSGSVDSIGQILEQLASDTPPVVISCSTLTAFLDTFIEKYKKKTPLTLVKARSGEFLQIGNVYFVPAQKHGELELIGGRLSLKLSDGPPVFSQKPSADVLFKSAASIYPGGVYGVLLSSFGADGVEGLKALQSTGSSTVAQIPSEASFPFGPQKAIEQGLVQYVLPLAQIPEHLMAYRNRKV